MVDDKQLLEFYPVILQILRNAADWIQESIDDLQWLVDDMERLYFSPNHYDDSSSSSSSGYATFLPSSSACSQVEVHAHAHTHANTNSKAQDAAAIGVFKKNWESVKSKQHRLAKTLLTRIARKQAEVESFKDAVSFFFFFPLPWYPHGYLADEKKKLLLASRYS